MLKAVRFILILSLVVCGHQSAAQNLSNKGKEFWVGYGHHQFMEWGTNNQEMVLYFSAEQTANVTVIVRGRTATQTTNYMVPAGTVIASNYMPKAGSTDCRLYDVPPTFGGNGGEGLFNVSIQILSDVPIVAYAHIFGNTSSGATMLMPVETWGHSYISINSKQSYDADCFSWFYVIAQHDNTMVEITPSQISRLNKPANVPFTVTLNKGQIYQVMAGPESGSSKPEMSGSKIRSIANASGECYPIAVFSGSSRTRNPISCGQGGGDNDNQQLFPTQAWGKRYLTAPTSRATAANLFQTNSYKVLVKDPTTVVKRNGVVLTGLTNSYYFFESSSADYIEADKPVMVAQFMTGGTSCAGSIISDPEMIYISPLEQGIKRVGFYRNTEEIIQINYLTLIIPSNGVPSLRIDGSSAFDHTYAHPQLPGYSVVVKRWSPASQAQCIVTSDSAFTAITYGLGSQESYGYNAGTLINNLSAFSHIHNTPDPATPQHAYSCVGTPIELSALVAYQPTQLDFLLSALGSAVTPNADVSLTAPVPSGTVTVNGLPYYKYTLPGTYTFNVADTFTIPLLAYHPTIENCYLRDSLNMQVIVKETPIAEFSISHTGCTLDPVNFTGVATTSNNYTVAAYNWTFPTAPTTATGQVQSRLLPPGTHSITLDVISAEGCVDDTTRTIEVFDKPPANFEITPAALCVGSAFTITDTSSVNASIAVTEWWWDFGNSVTQTVTTGPSVTYTYPAPGTYTIKHVSRSSVTCESDTTFNTVTVYSKPTTGISFPTGCIDQTGLVQFNGTATTPDGQTISTWAWNFGDPNASGGNPNTSAIQNPTHNYQPGTYTIQLTATTNNGCAETATVTTDFNLTPSLDYPALTAVCENAAPVSVASASVTNGVTGTGVYSGPGTSATGMFDPAAAGPGTHTITYTFTSNASCVETITQTILVHGRPRPNFTFPTGGACLPSDGMVQFNNTSTIPDGQSMTWLWNFGDPNATGANPNTSTDQHPIHYFGEGTFAVQLTATSANGCVKDTTINATFAVTPALSFPPIPGMCANPGSAPTSVANAALTNNVTGTGIYSGPGVDASGMFDPTVAGPGTHTITYTFTTAGGCSASVTSTVEVYPKPVASFTTGDDFCLDETITLTPNSSISGGSITNWNWDLGNGNTPSYTNGNPFTVTYSTHNTYTVKLINVSDRGCYSDPFTKTIGVHALPVANFTLPAGICMPGGEAVFSNLTSIPDNSSLTYQWDFGDGGPGSTAMNPSYVYAASGSYNVTLVATSAFGCQHQVTQTMNDFYEKPIALFSVSPPEICQGVDQLFSDASSDPGSTISSWNWDFDDGSNSSQSSPTKQFTNAGTYDVTLTVTNAVGCVSDPYVIPVTVHLQPVIDAGQSFVLPQGTSVQFTATANSPNLTFSWSPPFGLDDATLLKPTVTAMQDQTYTLTATGEFGCTATDFITVKILKPVKIPNVFSPNNDGIHDKWNLENLSDYPGATVEVFNRYGQQVFYSSGYGTQWDGTYRGKALPVGVYYYVIVLQNGFKPMTGSVTILK